MSVIYAVGSHWLKVKTNDSDVQRYIECKKTNFDLNDYFYGKICEIEENEYPDSIYASTTGEACECHQEDLSNLNNEHCTCVRYDSSIQCAGFAAKICEMVTGKNVRDEIPNGVSNIIDKVCVPIKCIEGTNSDETKENLVKFLEELEGSSCLYVRYSKKEKSYNQHSIIITDINFSEQNCILYHCNYHSYCMVSFERVTFDQLCNDYKINYIYSFC